MDNKPKEQSANKPAKNNRFKISRKWLLIFVVIILVVLGGISIFIYINNKKTEDKKNTANTIEENTIVNSQDPLNAGRPTGEALLSELESLKEQITKLKTEIENTPAPKTDTEQLVLAKKYLKLGDLYINTSDYAEALDALSSIYNQSVITTINLNNNREINMEAQGMLGLVFYNMGKYKLSLDAYNRAIAIAGFKPAPEADMYNPDRYKKYNEALVIVKTKI